MSSLCSVGGIVPPLLPGKTRCRFNYMGDENNLLKSPVERGLASPLSQNVQQEKNKKSFIPLLAGNNSVYDVFGPPCSVIN